MSGFSLGSIAALAGPMTGIDQEMMNKPIVKAIMNLASNPVALKAFKEQGTIPEDLKLELKNICKKLNESNSGAIMGGRRSTRKSRKSKKTRKSKKSRK